MESMLIGSFQKPTLSFPFAAELCSLPTGNNLICKDFSTVGRLYSLPERLCVRRRNLMHQPVKNIAQRRITLNPKGDSKYVANSSSGHSLESEPSKSPLGPVQQAFDAFYRFSRPHTVIGTALSIVSVSLLAVEKVSDFSPLFFAGLLEAIIAALLMNIYIVGLNQISDIEIDKVNKPYLPLASGEYSLKTGVLIVSSFGILIPLLRWKRFAVVAAMCIFAVRAVIVQIAFYLHIQTYVFGRPGTLTKPVIFATAFMSFFSVVIALFKDIPDIVGDKIYGIQSFTVRLGQEKVFWICISLLEMAYAVALFVGITSCCTWSKWVTVIGHTVLGYLLWRRAKCIDFKNKAAITSFYMFIWKVTDPIPSLSLVQNEQELMRAITLLCRVFAHSSGPVILGSSFMATVATAEAWY
ncbi:hypothetical protein SASPL_114697 [Salvia splendens]|uniref:Homogentisate phytyltransferase / homogentisate geranylgeranyltransferase n=1 Tax=Salvia splendens TaxID=180675 RepID=A0A8X8Y590_SALSN|nr:hypothetical protein SASPL_114697 [Salvia splendens]